MFIIIVVYCPDALLSEASWTSFVGVSPRRTELIPRPFRAWFVEGKVTLEQDFLLVIRFSPANIILAMVHTHPFIYHWRCLNLAIDARTHHPDWLFTTHGWPFVGRVACHIPLSYAEFKSAWSSTSIIDTSSTNSS